jgi:hypothetical protein
MDRTISELADQLVNQAPLYTRDRINKSGPPPPFETGVYGWWFEEGALPLVPTTGCVKRDRQSLLYIGFVPKRTLHNRIVGDDF